MAQESSCSTAAPTRDERARLRSPAAPRSDGRKLSETFSISPTRVVLYVRVSSKDQEAEGFSISAQSPAPLIVSANWRAMAKK